jgi:PKD repeat protein
LFNITGLASGIYQVSLINSLDMDVKKTIEIRGGTPVQASISAGTTNAVAAKDLVDFAASVEGTYTDITWNFGDGSTVSGTLTPVHMFTEPGIFTVTFIASNANCMDVQQMQISVSANVTGIADVQNATFSVYPNPVSSGSTTLNLNLKQMEPELLLHLIDAAGRIVKTQRIARTEGSVQVQLEVADLANGVYQLLVQGKNFSTAAKITIAK